MARLRNLNNVAAGLLGTFMSRYNDIAGHWAMGILRADHPGGSGTTTLSLLERRAVPASPATALAVENYALRLQAMLAHHALAPGHLLAAQIRIEFDAAVQIPRWRSVSWYGEPFRCTVTLTDVRGTVRTVSGVGRCAVDAAALPPPA